MNKLIEKYLRGTISEDERATLQEILAHYGYTLDEIVKEEDETYTPDSLTSARMWTHIHRIQSKGQYPKKNNWKWPLRIAASLVVLSTFYFLLHHTNEQQIEDVWLTTENPGSGILKITLSDSTQIWLNAHSKIAYPKNYNQDSRQVRLTGQAYFDVKRDTSRAFTVYADSLEVQVLGTSFVVSNYPEESKRTVAVVSGRVQSHIKGEEHAVQVLNPGDRFGYLVGSQKIIQNHTDNIEELHAWRNGTLLFRDESLETVTRALSRRYQVAFHFSDEQLKKKTVTMKIRNESITTVMDVLQSVSDISYEIKGKQIHIQ